MFKQLTILMNMSPLDFVGPVNACIAIGEALRDRGHRIVFAVSDQWKGKLNIYGFEEEIMDLGDCETPEDPAEYWAEFCSKSGLFGPTSPMEKITNMNMDDFIIRTKTIDPLMKEIVDRVKPDIILIDTLICMPSLVYSGIPWVLSMSCNPLLIEYTTDDERIPPSGLGLPTNGDHKEWKKLRDEKNDASRKTWSSFNDWLQLKGFPSLPKDKLIMPSPYLNIYMYPEELDYKDMIPSNWCQFDCFKRSGDLDLFEIPEKLQNKTGKLIYLSMGSMGSADVQLMKKLVSILSKSNHRFIVSKGPLSDQYELADNMWGERFVPQIKVLPIVDLVITHGGNNTLTETFFFGKPMLVMPLFFDQFDNAQRIEEKELGLRLNPYECTETELLQSIDRLLNDENLALKFENISKRIQNSQSVSKVAQLIEGLVK